MTSEAVRVVVRCRPFNSREKQLKSKVKHSNEAAIELFWEIQWILRQNIIDNNPSTLQCTISSPQDANNPPKTFTFDGVYDQTATTEQIYTDFVYSLVEVSPAGGTWVHWNVDLTLNFLNFRGSLRVTTPRYLHTVRRAAARVSPCKASSHLPRRTASCPAPLSTCSRPSQLLRWAKPCNRIKWQHFFGAKFIWLLLI